MMKDPKFVLYHGQYGSNVAVFPAYEDHAGYASQLNINKSRIIAAGFFDCNQGVAMVAVMVWTWDAIQPLQLLYAACSTSTIDTHD